jgi:hypothetical protein
MSLERAREVRLTLADDPAFLPLVQAFVEKSAAAFGLAENERLALTLAGEEIFNYLCTSVRPGAEIALEIRNGGFFTELDFLLPLGEFALKAFNLTATVDLEDEESLNEMGLVIASRMSDHLEIVQDRPGHIRLRLRKEKSYPRVAAPADRPEPAFGEEFTIVKPEPEELKFLLQLLAASPEAGRLPPAFSYPGKLVDMVASGFCRAAIARDERRRIGGGIVWFPAGGQVVECQGPYLTAGNEENLYPSKLRRRTAEALLEYCLNDLARKAVVGLLNRAPGRFLPAAHFETLGSLRDRRQSPDREIPAYFRQMQEDPGCVAWCHAAVTDFISRECRRLALPRELRPVDGSGENLAEHSVLAGEFDRTRSQVTLRPLWAGRDLTENLASHLELLADENLVNILFALDLGRGWEAGFIPALVANGFVPCQLLPYGGRDGDLLIFQKLESGR